MNVARLCHAAQWFAMNRIAKNVAQEPTENESAGFLSEEGSTRFLSEEGSTQLSTVRNFNFFFFFFRKKEA